MLSLLTVASHAPGGGSGWSRHILTTLHLFRYFPQISSFSYYRFPIIQLHFIGSYADVLYTSSSFPLFFTNHCRPNSDRDLYEEFWELLATIVIIFFLLSFRSNQLLMNNCLNIWSNEVCIKNQRSLVLGEKIRCNKHL